MVNFEGKVKLRCKKCGDIVQSKYSGHFSSCTCGSVSVDESEFCCRISGDYDGYEDMED